MVGEVLVHLIQDGAKFLCHRKEKGWRLKGTKTLLYASIIMIVYIMIIGVGCYGIGWGMGDGMYFSLITFTTIGLGDYAPEFDSTRGAMFKFVGYFGFGLGCMVGLSLLTTVLAGVQEAIEDYHEKMMEKMKAENGDTSVEEPTKKRKPKGILGVLGGGAINLDNDEAIDAQNKVEAEKQAAEEP